MGISVVAALAARAVTGEPNAMMTATRRFTRSTANAGIRTEFLFASVESEIDTALDGLGARSQALIIHPDSFFLQNSAKLAALAIREKLPTLYSIRDLPAAGGLMSYGSNFFDTDRQAGVAS